MGSPSLLQGIFPTQGLNPGLLHCRWILYQLSHKGSPRILEWVAYPFPSGSSGPRNRIGVYCIADGLFTNWAIREAPYMYIKRGCCCFFKQVIDLYNYGDWLRKSEVRKADRRKRKIPTGVELKDTVWSLLLMSKTRNPGEREHNYRPSSCSWFLPQLREDLSPLLKAFQLIKSHILKIIFILINSKSTV